MTLFDLYIMRHELLLTALILIIASAAYFSRNSNKKLLNIISLALFSLVTFIGFLPLAEGILFGGMYLSSPLLMIMKNILNAGTLIILIQSYTWLNKPENSGNIVRYYILILLSLLGMDLMLSSGTFLIFYLGMELATMPVAAFTAMEVSRKSQASTGIKLLLVSAMASAIILFGLSMVYGATGSIAFSELLKLNMRSTFHVLGVIIFFTGMAFKISIIPFHLWSTDIYENAPVNTVSFISVISTSSAFFILIIILYSVFPTIPDVWQKAILLTSLLAITAGNILALKEKNIRRFLAFSSFTQAGYILIAIIGANMLGMASLVYYIIIYILSNLGLFGVVNIISEATGKKDIDDYTGLFQNNPKLSLVMMLSILSLAGIPPLAGFFGRFFIFSAAAEKGFYFLILMAALNMVISLFYYLRLVRVIFINTKEEPIVRLRTDFLSRVGLIACLAGILITGFAGFLFEFIMSVSFGV